MKDLFLCATPLQAVIARAIANQLGIVGYDLVYSTRLDSPTDRRYSDELAKQASSFLYLAGTPGSTRITRLMRRLWRARKLLRRGSYGRIFVASLESELFRLLITRNPDATIYSFDDGAANILACSRLHRASPGLPDRQSIIRSRDRTLYDRIATHFSIYRGFPNIVGEDRLRYIDPWPVSLVNTGSTGTETMTFFIGQPYEDAIAAGTLDRQGLALIAAWLQANRPGHYLQHPRESRPLLPPSDAKPTDLIAEERLFHLCSGRRPVIYGWFSTVLFNIGPDHADKFYLSIGRGEGEAERCRLAEQAGCRVLTLQEDSLRHE